MTSPRRTATAMAAGALVAGALLVGQLPGPVPAQARPTTSDRTPAEAAALATTPSTSVRTTLSGLTIPWDVAPLPSGSVLLTEGPGRLRVRTRAGTSWQVQAGLEDLYVKGKVGLMGLVLDPGFPVNRRFYTCQTHREGTTPVDIRVVPWTLSTDERRADRSTAILTGLPIKGGQHFGCRLRFAADGTLRVGTGDAGLGTAPQSLSSLGGKTLRLRRDGTVPPDNPFAGRRDKGRYVFTYGHRNVQGMAARPGTGAMWSAEHGPARDDEVNLLRPGRNYGWDPAGPGGSYDDTAPMTDTARFPSAIRARWSSGYPTVAPSGATFLTGSAWGRWEGALAVAELKGSGVRVLTMTPRGVVTGSEQMPQVDDRFGRLRAVQSAADHSLYVTTSNSTMTTTGVDSVLRVVPQVSRPAYDPGADVSPSGVAAVARGARVTVFVRGTTGLIHHRTQEAPGAPWSAWATIPGAVGSAPAALSVDGSRIDLVARGSDGQLLHTWSTSSGYAPWRDLGGVISSAPSIAATQAGELDVLARAGAGDALYRKRMTAGRWQPWVSLGGVITAAPAAAANRSTGLTTVHVRGRTGELYRIVLSRTGVARGWAPQGDRLTWSAPAVTPASRLLVTRNADGTPVVAEGDLITAIGGRITGAPAVARRPDGTYAVLGRGGDGALWLYDGRAGSERWASLGGRLD